MNYTVLPNYKYLKNNEYFSRQLFFFLVIVQIPEVLYSVLFHPVWSWLDFFVMFLKDVSYSQRLYLFD